MLMRSETTERTGVVAGGSRMRMPGFTADSSLGPAAGIYRAKAAPDRINRITPQIEFQSDPDLGSYWRCRLNGGNELICRFFAGLPPFTIGRLSR
jgi:hypothetical protein